MYEMYFNSVLYALGCALTSTYVCCHTAYMCAKFPNRFSKIVYGVVIVAMIVPIVGNAPAEIRMAQAFGFYDRIWGMWLMRANFLGMYFLVFYAAFRQQPAAYTEAAKIDGAGNLAVYLRIALPLAANLFLTVLLINFITFWNDYQTPLMYLPNHPTVAYGMYRLPSSGNETGTVPMVMTGAVMVTVPVMAIFLVFHGRLLGNLTVGGIKG